MNKTVTKHEEVKNRLEKAIRQGTLIDKLPGERRLAKEYGVSYMTLRKAVENLVEQGLLYRIPKKGTFVNPNGAVVPNSTTEKRRHLVDAIELIAEIPDSTPVNGGRRQDPANRASRENRAVDDAQLLQQLERENRELKRANEILKKVAAYFAEAEQDRSAS